MNDPLRPKPDAAASQEPSFDDADVAAMVDEASAMKADAERKLTRDEMKEVGREIGLEERYLDRAVDRVALDRQQARAEAEAQVARRALLARRGAIVGAAAVGLFVVVTMVGALGARSRMQAALVDVDKTRAQVANVVERQDVVQQRYQGKPATAESEAEISGAENRVRIERRRYDEAAAVYNAAVRGFGGGLASTLFGLPDHVPPSNEVTRW